MKIFNTDGSLLMEIKTIERNGSFLEFRGTVMGAMPVKGRLTPEEGRAALKLIRPGSLWAFLLTFLFRRSPAQAQPGPGSISAPGGRS